MRRADIVVTLLVVGLCVISLARAEIPAQCPQPIDIAPTAVMSGFLGPGDCTLNDLDPTSSDFSYYDPYRIVLPGSGTFSVDLESSGFDAFLWVTDLAATSVLAFDDDSGGGVNGTDSALSVHLAAGSYLVLANSFDPMATGAYLLRTQFQPDVVSIPSADVVVDFGAIGLWARMNDARWLKLNNSSPDQLVVGDVDGNGADDVIAYFSGFGGIFVKRNLGGWSQFSTLIPEAMAVGDLDGNGKDDVVIDFGGIGLWARMNDASWLKLHNSSPGLIATGDLDGNGADDVVATFAGLGLWQKLNLGGWSVLSNTAPDAVVTGDVNGTGKDDVIADFGSTLGGIFVKRDQGAWVKLHNTSPDSMAIGNLDNQ
jgi:hypothetical protein